MSSIGVDIGASHISCGVYNNANGKLECKIYQPNRGKINLDIETSTKSFISLVIKLIDKLIIENRVPMDTITSIGLGCPGGIDRENAIFLGSSALNITQINWKNELEKYGKKVFVENDCTCAGICESYVNGIDNFVMFTLGSGLGISYMKDYKSISEIVWDIAELNKKIGAKHDRYIRSFEKLSQRYNECKGEVRSRGEIFKCVENGDLDAKKILNDYIENFIDGIIKIEEKYSFKKYSIGGGMSEYSRYFIDEIRKRLPNIDVRIAKYKNDSGIIGGALLEKI